MNHKRHKRTQKRNQFYLQAERPKPVTMMCQSPFDWGCIKSPILLLKGHPELVSGSHYQWLEIPRRARNDLFEDFWYSPMGFIVCTPFVCTALILMTIDNPLPRGTDKSHHSISRSPRRIPEMFQALKLPPSGFPCGMATLRMCFPGRRSFNGK